MRWLPDARTIEKAYFISIVKGLGYAGLVLVFVGLVACDQRQPVVSVATIVSPASSPKLYADYAEVAPLFQQENDTTYLVNFWATWCKPCLEELPLLQQLGDQEANKPLEIVLVSLDTEPGAIKRIPAYLEQKGIDLATIVLTDDGTEWKRVLDEKWDGSLPTTLIYRNGLRYVYRRPFMSMPDLQAAVSPLLGQ